jgi:hypothetical protein
MRNRIRFRVPQGKGVTTLLPLLFFFLFPSPSVRAQARGLGVGFDVSTTVGAMKEVSRRDGRWAFPLTASSRIQFFRVFHLELAWTHLFTHRFEAGGCFDGPCPGPDAVWGSSDYLTIGGGVNRAFGVWTPSIGVARGRGWESQPRNLDEFEGPLWAWYAGIERRLGARTALRAEYRGIWQHWEHDFENISRDIHFRQHEFGVGFTYSLF